MSSAQTSGNPNAADRCETLSAVSFEMSNAPRHEVQALAAGEESLGLRGDGLHAGDEAVAHVLVARALPLGEPGAGDRAPVGAETQVREVAVRIVDVALFGAGQLARGEHGAQRAPRLDLLAHEIADAFVAGQVVVVAAIQRRADAQLFGRAAPVHDVVARAQRREASEMMHVDFAGVPRHGFGEAERSRRGRCAGSTSTATGPWRARSCPTRTRRRRSATRGGRNRRCA